MLFSIWRQRWRCLKLPCGKLSIFFSTFTVLKRFYRIEWNKPCLLLSFNLLSNDTKNVKKCWPWETWEFFLYTWKYEVRYFWPLEVYLITAVSFYTEDDYRQVAGICSSKSNEQDNDFDNKMPAIMTVISDSAVSNDEQQTLHIFERSFVISLHKKIHKKILPNILMNMCKLISTLCIF